MIYHLSFYQGEIQQILNPQSAPQETSWTSDDTRITRREVSAVHASFGAGFLLAVGTLVMTLLAARRFRLTCGRTIPRPEPIDTRYEGRLSPRAAVD
jgi:hypothetical protein